MVNDQPAEKPVYDPEGKLDIIDIWKTIQGEGPLAGTPAIFIRLAGCSLSCPACDIEYTKGRKLLTYQEIVNRVNELAKNTVCLVVLTGGEPLRQYLIPLLNLLIIHRFSAQIETNGVHEINLRNYTAAKPPMIICSPKTGTINHHLLPHIYALKYIVEAGKVDPEDGLPTSVLGMECRVARPPVDFSLDRIYVQAQDDQDPEKNKKNIEQAVDSCLRFGYKLSFQIHKLIGVA